MPPAGGDNDTDDIGHEQEAGSPVDKAWAEWFSGRGGHFGALDDAGWLELRSKLGDDANESATKLLLNHGLPPGQRRCGVMGYGVSEWGSGQGRGCCSFFVRSGCYVLGGSVAPREGNDTSCVTTGRTFTPPQASMESVVWGVRVKKQPACDHVPGTRANTVEPAGAIRGIYLFGSVCQVGNRGNGEFRMNSDHSSAYGPMVTECTSTKRAPARPKSGSSTGS